MKKTKGFAKIEMIANLEMIKDLSDKGFSKKAIYDLLSEKGQITMSYQNFCTYDLKGVRKKIKKSFTPGVPNTRSAPALTPAIPARNCEGGSSKGNSIFVHKNAVTEEDLEQELVGK